MRDKDSATSGQLGPKSKKERNAKNASKFRRESNKVENSKLRTEKTEAKLGKARDNLAKQKPPKKPGVVKNVSRAAKFQTWRYVHGKIHQVERENVGVEAAHKTELAGEKVVRSGSRFIKKNIRTRPVRQVRKWEKKNIKAKTDYAFRKMAQEHPEIKKNAFSRLYQKQRIKRQYQKQAKNAAKQGGKAAKQAAVTTEKIVSAAVSFISRNPKLIVIIAIALVLVFILQACMGMFMTIGNSLGGAIGGTSYLAEDSDIDLAELAYTEWETDLQLEINAAESTYPNYDEYRYNVADISHNPYELMAFLTAVYDDFIYTDVESVLRDIFNEQYTLDFTEEIETRYRTETHTDPDTGAEIEVEVAYDYYILHITLTARSFSQVVFSRMNAEQRERFNAYMITKGNRQYLQSPFGELNWLPYVSSYYGYRIHPVTGEKNYHRGLDIAMPEGTEILAGHDGTVTFAGSNGDYGLVVELDNGEDLVSKYAHCSALLVSVGQTVTMGTPIARVGNTGQSTGPHLHLEIIKDGISLNPLYFTVTNDYGQGPTYGDPGAAMGDGSYAALIAEAELHLGKPYVFGANGPNSFDCSSFVCWVFTHSGVYNLPRTTAQGIFNQCTPVSPGDAKPGDLIFFTGTYSTTDACSHIGIYVGNGQMIHAGNPIQYTSINSSYWQSHFYSYGRLPG